MQSANQFSTITDADLLSEWEDQVVEAFSEDFFQKNEDWINNSREFKIWASTLCHRPSKKAAAVIERAFNIKTVIQSKMLKIEMIMGQWRAEQIHLSDDKSVKKVVDSVNSGSVVVLCKDIQEFEDTFQIDAFDVMFSK